MLILTFALGTAAPAGAKSQLHMNGRIRLDAGPASGFVDSEQVFMKNLSFSPPVDEESDQDSRWQDSDISQIRITWDADSIYIGGYGVINGNNMILLFDVGHPNPGLLGEKGVRFDGLVSMANLNSWRRNFFFDNGFSPSIFLATWDGNTTPKLESVQGPNTVLDEYPTGVSSGTGQFHSAASFSGTNRGGAMVFSLPWWKFLGFTSASGLERRFVPALGDTVTVLPDSVRYVRFAGLVTGGGDGTGGPDAAPDNLSGFQLDASIRETIDNYAILDLDADGDHIPDFGVNPKDRIRFFVPPPVSGVRFELDSLAVDRPSFAPSRSQVVRFHFIARPTDVTNRQLSLSADIYDLRGQRVRHLYQEDHRLTPNLRSPLDAWDGKDDQGAVVPGGVYLVRLILEPGQARALAPVVVAR